MAGAMGWDDHRFYCSTPRFFFNAYKGWADIRQNEYRRSWEQTRLIAYITAAGKGAKVTPEDIVPLPWIDDVEKANEFPEITKEEYEKFGEEADLIFQKMQSEWQQ
ncbi:MAG: hypothetical protein EBR82_85140 [Caulobacteraceae bacterium]|nr:hypothetical protein [Caulobacteraceae bacterium]